MTCVETMCKGLFCLWGDGICKFNSCPGLLLHPKNYFIRITYIYTCVYLQRTFYPIIGESSLRRNMWFLLLSMCVPQYYCWLFIGIEARMAVLIIKFHTSAFFPWCIFSIPTFSFFVAVILSRAALGLVYKLKEFPHDNHRRWMDLSRSCFGLCFSKIM